MSGYAIILTLMAAFGVGWSISASLGGLRVFRAMRHDFGRTLLPVFAASLLSFIMLLLISFYSYEGVFYTLFFVFEAAMLVWLFRDYLRSMASILPAALFIAIVPAWIGLIAVAVSLYLAVFALLVFVSSRNINDSGSPLVFAADVVLVVSLSIQLIYAVLGHFTYFFLGAFFYTLAVTLLLTPAVAVEVIRRHATQPDRN